MKFFVSTESEFPKIYRQLPETADNFERLPKIAEGFQRLPKIFLQLLMITKGVEEGVERFSMTSKQGQQRFPNDFQPISSIIYIVRVPKMFSRLFDCQKTIEFLFNQYRNYTHYCQLGVRN